MFKRNRNLVIYFKNLQNGIIQSNQIDCSVYGQTLNSASKSLNFSPSGTVIDYNIAQTLIINRNPKKQNPRKSIDLRGLTLGTFKF